MLDDFFTRALVAGIGLALVAGPLGCFIVWRRMAYFGDTMAHSALLGVALAFLLNINLTLDSLTGATPNGAVPTNAPQTFTGSSGGESYTVPAGEVPLDPTFLDTRVAASANWQQNFGEASRWNVGFSVSDEYDYFHAGVNARFEHDFNLKNTTAYFGIAYGQDDIKPVGGADASTILPSEPKVMNVCTGTVTTSVPTGRMRRGRITANLASSLNVPGTANGPLAACNPSN